MRACSTEEAFKMTFLAFTWKNLIRRPVRLALTTLSLALAVCAIVSLVGLADGFERSLLDLYGRRGVDLVAQHSGGVMQLTRGVDQSLKPRIERIEGVRQVVAGMTDVVALEQFDLYAVIINGWEPDGPGLNEVTLTSGRRLRAGDQGRVMIGKVLAANTRSKVGDRIEIYAEPFEVVGIFESFSTYENGAIFILLDELQRLTDRRGKVTGYLINTTHPDDEEFVNGVARRIEHLDSSLAVTPAAEFVRSVSQIRVARAAAWITSAIAVTIGVAGTLNTMMMSVFERVREIGTLRAIGWRKRRVIGMVLCESLIISLLGAAFGLAAGLLTLHLMTYWPKVAGLVEGALPASVALQGCGLAVLAGILGAAYPAYWASRLSPVDALRAK
jgi:putative ABC transport system permease protein